MKNIRYNPRTFPLLPQEHQHKKLASLLRYIYCQALQLPIDEALMHHYLEICHWISFPALDSHSLPDLANRYHEHLVLARQALREPRLLPFVTHRDKSDSTLKLNVRLYLDHIRSAHNIGSILRTAEAFCFDTIYFSNGMALPDHKQVKDSAMGTAEWIHWQQVKNLKELPRPLIALETSPSALPIYGYPFPKGCTLALGNEEYGCSPDLLAEADEIVNIPLYGRKNSLNVANAFAIVAAEIIRQKLHSNT